MSTAAQILLTPFFPAAGGRALRNNPPTVAASLAWLLAIAVTYIVAPAKVFVHMADIPLGPGHHFPVALFLVLTTIAIAPAMEIIYALVSWAISRGTSGVGFRPYLGLVTMGSAVQSVVSIGLTSLADSLFPENTVIGAVVTGAMILWCLTFSIIAKRNIAGTGWGRNVTSEIVGSIAGIVALSITMIFVIIVCIGASLI